MGDLSLILFDILNFGLVVLLWWFTATNYKSLPEKIPTHFDVEGKADQLGNKKFSFLIPALGILFYTGIFFLVRFPTTVNFPVEITEANQGIQFFIMNFFMRWFLLLVLLIFLNSQDYMFRYSYDKNAKVKVSFSTMLFAVIGSLIAVFVITSQFK
nr:DUF1648 domain-containing protein [uncultured Chryseobacterium sp.]